MSNKPTLIQQVAAFLEVEADQIHMVKPYETHINVILADFRKTAVSHADLEAAQQADDDTPPAKEELAKANHMLSELEAIIANPQMHDRDALRTVATDLDIEGAAEMNKKDLVKAINAWKQAQEPTNE
jgi:hypothetical protein